MRTPYLVFIATVKLGRCRSKVVIDSTQTKERDCVPIKLTRC